MSCVNWSQKLDSFNRLSNPTAFFDSGVKGRLFHASLFIPMWVLRLMKAINLESSFFCAMEAA